jgi:hypothetical protein
MDMSAMEKKSNEFRGSIWNRIPGEHRVWYRRFLRYRDLGPSRSVAAAWRNEQNEREAKGIKGRGKRPSRHWYQHAKDDLWVRRAERWDAHVQVQEEQLWKNRRKKLREKEFQLAEKFLDRVEALLSKPTPDGWKLTDIARMLEIASKVARLSSELTTGVQETRHVVCNKYLSEEDRIRRVKEILERASLRSKSGPPKNKPSM